MRVVTALLAQEWQHIPPPAADTSQLGAVACLAALSQLSTAKDPASTDLDAAIQALGKSVAADLANDKPPNVTADQVKDAAGLLNTVRKSAPALLSEATLPLNPSMTEDEMKTAITNELHSFSQDDLKPVRAACSKNPDGTVNGNVACVNALLQLEGKKAAFSDYATARQTAAKTADFATNVDSLLKTETATLAADEMKQRSNLTSDLANLAQRQNAPAPTDLDSINKDADALAATLSAMLRLQQTLADAKKPAADAITVLTNQSAAGSPIQQLLETMKVIRTYYSIKDPAGTPGDKLSAIVMQ